MKRNLLKKIVKTVEPEYEFIKIKPHKKGEEKINMLLNEISRINLEVDKRVKFNFKNGITINCKYKLAYMVQIDKDNVFFIFMVPKFLNENGYIEELFEKCYTKNEIHFLEQFEVEKLLDKMENKYTKSVVTRYKDLLSLNTNEKISEEFFAVKEQLKNDETITLFLSIRNTNQRIWRMMVTKEADSLPKKTETQLQRSSTRINNIDIYSLSEGYIQLLQGVKEVIGNSNKKDNINENLREIDIYEKRKNIAKESLNKRKETVFKTQINIVADGDKADKVIDSIESTFSNLDSDNKICLVDSKEKNFTIFKNKYKGDTLFLSKSELNIFLKHPDHIVMSRYNIDYTRTNQIHIPDDFYPNDSYQILGINYVKKTKELALMPNQKNTNGGMHVIVGPPGAGKSVLIQNNAVMILKSNNGFLFVDTEDKNLVATNIENLCKTYKIDDRLISIDLEKDFNNYGFIIKEVRPSVTKDILSKKRSLKIIGEALIPLLEVALSETMDIREQNAFVSAACVAYFLDENSPLKNIFDILTDHKIRNHMINKAKAKDGFFTSSIEGIGKEITRLEGLNIYTQDLATHEFTPIGTKYEEIKQIEKIEKVFENSALEQMYLSNSKKMIDIRDAIAEGKGVVVKLPSGLLPEVKNIISTFFYLKAFMGASEMLDDKARPFTVLTDEIHELESLQEFLAKRAVQLRKRQLKYWITLHDVNQLTPPLRKILRSTSSNFVVFPSVNKRMYEELKEIVDINFDYEDDLMELKELMKKDKRFALCSILYDEGQKRANFVVELPPDLMSIAQPVEYLECAVDIAKAELATTKEGKK